MIIKRLYNKNLLNKVKNKTYFIKNVIEKNPSKKRKKKKKFGGKTKEPTRNLVVSLFFVLVVFSQPAKTND